jgi:acyl-CoA dehydrogenase
MDFGLSERQTQWRDRVRAFMTAHVYPAVATYQAQMAVEGAARWQVVPIVEELKARAYAEGLWNLFLTPSEHDEIEDRGPGLTNLEYALCAEEMGRVGFASEVFNCSAPDTGNMEVLRQYGSAAQKARWLRPLLAGEIRSAFLMTEPDVASSDATNIQTSIRRDGDSYVINGRKWWSSGVGDPRCKISILMGKTDPEGAKHAQQSQILVPTDAPGFEIVRMLPVFGYDDAPHGHAEVVLRDVRVPVENLILGEGRGFEIAQGRLGPGRIHHCMRAIGQAERALEAMCRRAQAREAFGQKLIALGANHDIIAECRMSIEMARLLCLKAAWTMDIQGVRAAAPLISQIKVIAPRVALEVIDQAVQMHGGAGVSQDFPLASMWVHVRTLRLADGPDAVHRRVIAKNELKRYSNEAPRR